MKLFDKNNKDKSRLFFVKLLEVFGRQLSLSPFLIWSLEENPSDGQVEEIPETQAFIMVPPA